MSQATIKLNPVQTWAFCVVMGIAVVLCVWFTFSYAVGDEPLIGELQCTINPNEASPASLARLPGIGPVRAQAIVSYREKSGQDGFEKAFNDCDDLQQVKGIGPVTADGMCEWLRFE